MFVKPKQDAKKTKKTSLEADLTDDQLKEMEKVGRENHDGSGN